MRAAAIAALVVVALSATARAQDAGVVDAMPIPPTSTSTLPIVQEGPVPPTPVTETAIPVIPMVAAPDPRTTPTERGLPVVVRVAVYMAEIGGVDEAENVFEATVDVRLRWWDDRRAFPAHEAPGGFKEVRGEAAEARLAEIWQPEVAIANLVDDATYQLRGLREFPDGRIELMQRTTGKFATEFDVRDFPFDTQRLEIELVARRESTNRVVLDFRQDDVEFSRVADGVEIDGWTPGLLHLEREMLEGWHGDTYARVYASLEVKRQAGKTVAAIFIPLIASLLIPLLALWLQRVEDGEIKIEAFELTNILIGGLFAVIALNFTISSEFPTLIDGDNTVTRLLGLNYLCLATSLVINIVVFRFDVVGRLFGKHVLTVFFRWLSWALPVLVLSTAAAIILVAMA